MYVRKENQKLGPKIPVGNSLINSGNPSYLLGSMTDLTLQVRGASWTLDKRLSVAEVMSAREIQETQANMMKTSKTQPRKSLNPKPKRKKRKQPAEHHIEHAMYTFIQSTLINGAGAVGKNICVCVRLCAQMFIAA